LLIDFEDTFLVDPALLAFVLNAGDFDWLTLRIFEGVPDLRDALDLLPVFLPFAPFCGALRLFLLAAEVFLFTALAALFLVPDDFFFALARVLLVRGFLPFTVVLDRASDFAAYAFLYEDFGT
jgi:hypothetical protein